MARSRGFQAMAARRARAWPGSSDRSASSVCDLAFVAGASIIRPSPRGFLRFSPLEGAVCGAVTTVPLPLECQIATGYVSFAMDLGGGIAVAAADRVHVRVEAGNLMVRYGQEAHRSNGELSDGFTSQSIQVSSAVVWRF